MARSYVEAFSILALCGAALITACQAPRPKTGAAGAEGPKPRADAPGATPRPGGRAGVHGMVVFGGGGGPVFFSHIPMFHGPHDMQAIFEVSLDNGPARYDTGLFTFKPAPFSLDDLVLGRLSKVSGTLYEGNFEQGGRPVGEASAGVVRVVVAEPLGARAAAPDALEYLALGGRAGAFLVHPITRAPDFDQILAVDLGEVSLSDEALRGGVTLVVPGRKNGVAERLQGGPVGVEVKGRAGAPGGPGGRLEVRRVLSTLVGPEFVDGP